MPYDDIYLQPYKALDTSGGGIFGGLFGGGQQQTVPGLLNGGGGNTDALINQLLQRQIEAATQPDWGAFSSALAKAAQPGPYPKSIGAALGEAAGALSGNREQSLARALQSAKLMQDLQLQRRKQNMFEQMFGSGAGNDPDISAAKDILGGAGIPGIKPLSSTAPRPRPVLSDTATGDLSPTTGDVPTGDSGGIDPDLLPSATAATRPLAHLNYGGTGALGDPRAPGWAQANLTTVSAPGGASFRVHNAAAPDIKGFLAELEERGYPINPETSGGHALRNIRGGNTLSEHAYGTAVDLNWDKNAYTKDGRLITNLPSDVAQIAAKYNLEWGGNWKSPVDAMHFQWRPGGGQDTGPSVVQAAYRPAKDRFLNLAEPLESGGRNLPNAQGGSAGGYFQITPETWRDFAPPEVRAQYASAMDAPRAVQRAVAQRIPVNRWTDNNPRLAAAAREGGLLQTLSAIDPRQSPTAAIAGGLPPPDEVIPSGARPALPGLLKAQYSTVPGVDPSQSPAVALGGGAPTPPMPPQAAPGTPPPMVPGAGGPVQAPTVPTPANMDPSRINQVLLNLARKSAMAEAAGFPNIYGPMISAIQQSPQYKAMQEYASKSATLPLEYLGPQYNVPLQTQLETAKQTAIQLGKFLGPEYDPTIQKMLKDIDERAKAPYGTPVEQTIELPDGTQQKMKMTPAEFADYRAGKGIAGMPPGARIVGEPAGQTAETQKARLELDTLDAKTLREQATAGRKILPLLGEVTRLAYEAPGGLSGRASAELARLLPFPVPAGWTNAEVLGSLGQQFLPSVRAPGAQSNAEMTAGLQAVPGLMQSQGGRVKIAAINKAMIERTIEMADIYREHLGTPELHRRLAELDKKPLFSDDIRREIGFGGNQGSQPAGAAPGSIKTPYGTISPVQ